VWKKTGLELLTTIKCPTAVTALAIHPSGKILLSGEQNKSVKMWDLRKGTPGAHMVSDIGVVESLSWSACGKYFAVLSQDGKKVQVVAPESGDVEV
jgi:WD40 repeat protein